MIYNEHEIQSTIKNKVLTGRTCEGIANVIHYFLSWEKCKMVEQLQLMSVVFNISPKKWGLWETVSISLFGAQNRNESKHRLNANCRISINKVSEDISFCDRKKGSNIENFRWKIIIVVPEKFAKRNIQDKIPLEQIT